jgi:hypothetical protein
MRRVGRVRRERTTAIEKGERRDNKEKEGEVKSCKF